MKNFVKLSVLPLMLAAGLAACTDTGAAIGRADAGVEPVSRAYNVYGIRWRGAGESLFAHRVKEVDGRVAVCGAYTNVGAGPLINLSGQVLRRARIVVNGRTVVSNLSFFQADDDADDGTMANCILTGTAWDPSFEGQSEMIAPTTTYEV